MTCEEVREQVIRQAIAAYPSDVTIDVDRKTIRQIIQAAKSHTFGDGLLEFVILELADTTLGYTSLAAARIEARRTLNSAAVELKLTIDGLSPSKEKPI